MELEKITMTEVTEYYINRIVEMSNVSKARAKDLFLNALIYNCVTEEVLAQAQFLQEA